MHKVIVGLTQFQKKRLSKLSGDKKLSVRILFDNLLEGSDILLLNDEQKKAYDNAMVRGKALSLKLGVESLKTKEGGNPAAILAFTKPVTEQLFSNIGKLFGGGAVGREMDIAERWNKIIEAEMQKGAGIEGGRSFFEKIGSQLWDSVEGLTTMGMGSKKKRERESE